MAASGLRLFTGSSAVPSVSGWRGLVQRYFVCRVPAAGSVEVKQYSTRHPLERRTMKELVGGVGGKLGGRAGKGRKKGGLKKMNFDQTIRLGEGKEGVRWPGLSYPLPAPSKRLYTPGWLQIDKLGIKKVDDDTDDKELGVLDMRGFSEQEMRERRESELNWSRKGWSGKGWRGRVVGCPETLDGTPLPDFKSIVIEMKRVTNQTKGGKKKTVSALVVVGNKQGAAGFSVGKGDTPINAIRKAKIRAANYLQYVPRCDGHTIYHNIQTKFKRTKLTMEKRVKGHGLSCQRAVAAICDLAGIRDMRAKIHGSTNPLNIVRATFKGLTAQETHQQLADKAGKYLVEYRAECGMRPVVIAVPNTDKHSSLIPTLRSMQMMTAPDQQPRDADTTDTSRDADNTTIELPRYDTIDTQQQTPSQKLAS